MRKIKIAPGEYYHIFNRGNNKQKIFLDKRDYIRFLFLILYFQSPSIFYNIGRQVTYFIKNNFFGISKNNDSEVVKKRYVELVNFVLIPNHFHLIILEKEEGGISRYMQRILTAYAKYFNEKYEKSGHLFQGPFQAVHIEDNNQLLYLSSYIHRNVRELKEWKNKEHLYMWSSYQDCSNKNRWGELLKHEVITEQFSNQKEYKDFVDSSPAKLESED
jgi:putative transposase